MHFFGAIWDKYKIKLVLIQHQNQERIHAATAPSKNDNFSEQY